MKYAHGITVLVLGCIFFFAPAGLFPAAAAERYSLAQAVETALERNFSISAAEAGHKATEHGVKSARGAFGPVLAGHYDYMRRQHRLSGISREQEDELHTWRASLTQNVFAGFATLSDYQKAALSEESARAGIDKARLDLANMVQEAFCNYMRSKQDVRSAQDALERLQSQLKSSRAFYDVGVSPRLDVLQAEVDVSTAESALLVAENTVETLKVRLNTLLVLPMDADVEYVGEFSFIPFPYNLDTCLAQAYSRRPDLLIAEKAVEIAGEDTLKAASGFYPQVSAQGAWATTGDDFSATGSRLQPQRYNEWSLNVFAEWPVFEWGKTYYGVQQAKQSQAKVRAEADNLRQEIIFDVKGKLLALTEAAKRIRVAQKAQEQAGEAYRMADARYRSHVGTMTDVLDAQAKLTAAEAAVTGARADYFISLSRLYAAVGELNPSLRSSGAAAVEKP